MEKIYLSHLLTFHYKVQTKKEKVEDFKAAISSTVRSISNSEKVEVIFGNQISKSSKNSLNLPNIERINNSVNFDEIRAIADSKSLKLRFSESEILKRFEPQGNISRKLYDISEKSDVRRLEQITSRE